jgi:hypothetical protein
MFFEHYDQKLGHLSRAISFYPHGNKIKQLIVYIYNIYNIYNIIYIMYIYIYSAKNKFSLFS